MCFKTPSYGGVLKLSTKLYSMRMNDCRTECPAYCAAKAAVESNISLHWANVQFDEAVQRNQFAAKLHHLNSIGILTDDEYSSLGALMPVDRTAEMYRLDKERLNVLAAHAMNCSGMKYAVAPVLGYIVGSPKVCPNEALWAKYV